ncbi:mechanosensitive ion channel family protein [Thermodesulfobacteriota bacterium]
MEPFEFISSFPMGIRVLTIAVLATCTHFIVRALKGITQLILSPKAGAGLSAKEGFALRYPKLATLTTILVSAITFIIYFFAVGLILKEFDVSMTKYLASASVIGLAIGFGSQGLVQDVVIGLTLIFSDAISIGDYVEISGQIGKVESIGLRFTTLINLHGQSIFIPNRTIGIIGRFRSGHMRAYVDIQIPDDIEEKDVLEEVKSIATGMHSQHRSIILSEPEIFGVKEAKAGKWRYLRVKFRLWPGQTGIIETSYKQRVVSVMKKHNPDYMDWMVTVTYRVE